MEIREYDLAGYVCPLSRIKAAEVLKGLNPGESIRMIIGDTESLKSIAQELRTRCIKPEFEKETETRFILTVVR
ncbi:sulfurtransferase TusA family protein [Dehalogenimonas sp. 4OHTPN]|uniref:Sulfurtransferase TusA family protein n=1 Tax=Dehalogenimonas sp. 4OHTPN TaxID=3166643 RepID=A0AAU8GEF2_9CHLR